MKNKKGLSAVIGTVLIILLVIAAVALIWSPIRDMIEKQSEQIEADCLLANIKIEKACEESGDISVTISNGAEGEVDGVQVIYGVDEQNLANTEEFTGAGNEIGINAIKTFTITGAAGNTSIRVAAIINDKNCEAGQIKNVAATC